MSQFSTYKDIGLTNKLAQLEREWNSLKANQIYGTTQGRVYFYQLPNLIIPTTYSLPNQRIQWTISKTICFYAQGGGVPLAKPRIDFYGPDQVTPITNPTETGFNLFQFSEGYYWHFHVFSIIGTASSVTNPPFYARIGIYTTKPGILYDSDRPVI